MHTFPSHVFLTYILHMVQIHAFDSWVSFFFFLSTSIFHSHALHPHISFTYILHMLQIHVFDSLVVFFIHITFPHARSPIALILHIHTLHVSKTRVRYPGLTFFYFIIYSCQFIYAPTVVCFFLLLYLLINFSLYSIFSHKIKLINHANKFRYIKHKRF